MVMNVADAIRKNYVTEDNGHLGTEVKVRFESLVNDIRFIIEGSRQEATRALEGKLADALLQVSQYKTALELIRDNTGNDDGEYAIEVATKAVGPLPADQVHPTLKPRTATEILERTVEAQEKSREKRVSAPDAEDGHGNMFCQRHRSHYGIGDRCAHCEAERITD